VPDSGLNDATCGNLNKLIHVVGDVVRCRGIPPRSHGDILHATASHARDKVGVTHLWEKSSRRRAEEERGQLRNPGYVLRKHYGKCFHRGAYTLANVDMQAFLTTEAPVRRLQPNFNDASARICPRICDSMDGIFRNQTTRLPWD